MKHITRNCEHSQNVWQFIQLKIKNGEALNEVNSKFIIIFFLSFLIFNPANAQDQAKLDSLNQVLNTTKQDTTKIITLLKIGDQYEYITPDTALLYYQKALKLAKTKKEQKFIAKCFNNIGNIYTDQSNYAKALDYFLQALKIYEELSDKDGIGTNLVGIGSIYYYQSNYAKALEYDLKALKIYEELGNKRSIAINLVGIGAIYAEQSNYDKALDYFLQALKINEELGDKSGIATNLGNIGIIYHDQSNYDKALDYFLQALKIFEELGDKNGMTYQLNSIANLYNDLKQYKKAKNYANKGLKLAKEIEALDLEQEVYGALTETYKGLNNYKKALEYKDKWIELKDSIFSTEKTASIADLQNKYNSEKQAIIDSIATAKQMEIKDAEIAQANAEKKVQQTQRNMFIIAFALMLLLAGFVFRSYRQKRKANLLLAEQKAQIIEANEELNQQNEEITDQKEKIEEIHHEISQSIDYATRLQGAILPEQKILTKYLSEHFVLFKPKDKVSGDFYWWAHIENHTIITAADSTGHGVPGAFMSMLGTSFLRDIVQKEYVTHTGVILRKLRKEIIKALKQTGEVGEQKDGMDMAIISIDHETNIVQFSGANNPLYIINPNRKECPQEAIPFGEALGGAEIKPDKMPIAIYEKMDNFTTHEIQLEKGDQLYMFSDGYADQFGGPKGKKFKYKAFKRLLLENADKPMQEQKEILNTAFEDWKGDVEQIDDVVVVGIKI